MENAFYIVACRFHVREKDRLLITGYFLENRPDGNRIEIRLDGKKMFYTMDGIRLHPMKFRKIKKKTYYQTVFFLGTSSERLERGIQTGGSTVVPWKRRKDEDICSQ